MPGSLLTTDTRTFFFISLVRILYTNSFERAINHHTDCLCLGRLKIACSICVFLCFNLLLKGGLENLYSESVEVSCKMDTDNDAKPTLCTCL